MYTYIIVLMTVLGLLSVYFTACILSPVMRRTFMAKDLSHGQLALMPFGLMAGVLKLWAVLPVFAA